MYAVYFVPLHFQFEAMEIVELEVHGSRIEKKNRIENDEYDETESYGQRYSAQL